MDVHNFQLGDIFQQNAREFCTRPVKAIKYQPGLGIENGFCVHCNSVQREHNKKLNNGLPILHMIPPYRDYGRYFCIQAGKGGTMRPGLIKYQAHFLYPKQEVLCTWQMIRT